MKKHIIIILIVFSHEIMAQKPLDTIYANENKNVALFFPEAIRQGITGANNFVFTYNREKAQYFGLLQATPGIDSNLLAVTENGQVYSYILKYRDQLSKLNYFISEKERIGSERPKEVESIPIHKSKPSGKINTPYFQKVSAYLLKLKYRPMASKREKGMRLQLQKMTYDASEVYLVFEIKNSSEIDFEIDYLKIFRATRNKKRKASFQSLEQAIVYKHKRPNYIRIGAKKRFVYVLPKFVLGKNEKLMVELKELKGNRKAVLETRIK